MAEERPVKSDAEDAAALVQNLRRRIDELDELLVRTLSARAACALEVGRQKKRLGSRSTSRRAKRRSSRTFSESIPGPLNAAVDQAAVRTHHRRGAAARAGGA
jgi:chorismate mutase